MRELADFYGLPCRANGCLADAKQDDYQSGAESMLICLSAAGHYRDKVFGKKTTKVKGIHLSSLHITQSAVRNRRIALSPASSRKIYHDFFIDMVHRQAPILTSLHAAESGLLCFVL